MNHLVLLDAQAGELERILSGLKTMLISEYDPPFTPAHPVNPGDSLFFLRLQRDSAIRVTATVTRVLHLTKTPEQDLSLGLKELQPRLQLTEEQYNRWSNQNQVLLVEIESAHKVSPIEVSPDRIGEAGGWLAFEDSSLGG